MPSELVACWTCYKITNRLSPGVHLDPDGTTSTDYGYAVSITETQIAEWDQARDERARKAAPTCPCCGDKTDINNECACWCLPDPNLPSCTGQPGCLHAAAKTAPVLSPTLEAELDELVAERDLESEPFPRG